MGAYSRVGAHFPSHNTLQPNWKLKLLMLVLILNEMSAELSCTELGIYSSAYRKPV